MTELSLEGYDEYVAAALNKLNELKSRQTAHAIVESLIDLIGTMQSKLKEQPEDLAAKRILDQLKSNTICKEIMPDLNLESFDTESAVSSLSSTASSAKLKQLFEFLFEGPFLNVSQASLLAPINLWRLKHPSLWIAGRLHDGSITEGTGGIPSLLANYHDSILKQCINRYQKKFKDNPETSKSITSDKIKANSAVLIILQHLAYLQTTLQNSDATLIKKLTLLHAVRLIVIDTFKKPIEHTENDKLDIRLGLFTELFDQVSALMLIEQDFDLFHSTQQDNGTIELQNSLIVYLEGMLDKSSPNKRTSVLSNALRKLLKKMTHADIAKSVTIRAQEMLTKAPAPVTKLPYLIYSMETGDAKPDASTLEDFALEIWSRASESDTTYRLLTLCFDSIRGNLQQFFDKQIKQSSPEEFRLFVLTAMYNTLIPVLNHIHRAALVLDSIDTMKSKTSVTTEKDRYTSLWETLNKYTVDHIESLSQHSEELLTQLEQNTGEDNSSAWNSQKEHQLDDDTSHIKVISSFLTDIIGHRRETVVGSLQGLYAKNIVKTATCNDISKSISATTASNDELKKLFDDTLKSYIESGDPEVLIASEFNPITQLNIEALQARAIIQSGFLSCVPHPLSKAARELDKLPANHLSELSRSRTRQDSLPESDDSDVADSVVDTTMESNGDVIVNDKDAVEPSPLKDNTPQSSTAIQPGIAPPPPPKDTLESPVIVKEPHIAPLNNNSDDSARSIRTVQPGITPPPPPPPPSPSPLGKSLSPSPSPLGKNHLQGIQGGVTLKTAPLHQRPRSNRLNSFFNVKMLERRGSLLGMLDQGKQTGGSSSDSSDNNFTDSDSDDKESTLVARR